MWWFPSPCPRDMKGIKKKKKIKERRKVGRQEGRKEEQYYIFS